MVESNMAILSEEIARRVQGHMGQNEDWWHLRYNTETETFTVRHSWSHTQMKSLKTNDGENDYPADIWTGDGANNIPKAKEKLLAQLRG
jgi:hypothetical protein